VKPKKIKQILSGINYHLVFTTIVYSLALLISIVFILFIVYACVLWFYRGKIFPGVSVNQVELGGLTREEAAEKLLLLISEKNHLPIEIYFEDEKWELIPSHSELNYDVNLATQQAYLLGRSNNISRFTIIFKIFIKGIDLPLSYALNKALLLNQLQTLSDTINQPAIPHKIIDTGQRSISDVRVVVEKGNPGKQVDKITLINDVYNRFTFLSRDPIIIKLLPVDSNFYSFNPELTRIKAERFLEKSLNISVSDPQKIQDSVDVLKGSDFFQFLSFDGNYQEGSIASYSATLSKKINRKPQNAKFVYANGRVEEFAPAIPGFDLDTQHTSQQLFSALQRLENESRASYSLELNPRLIEPQITIEDVNDLGIKELVGKGISKYRGSIPNRIHNLSLAANKISGDLIPPGEIFSFNKIIGEIDAAHGYKQGYIIKDGRTILGDGGGVCQVSTTLFRAALDAGLPIVERHAHSYRVGYYEQNSKAGYDATVFSPTADFKFKNDTSNYLLIQALTDTSTSSLSIEIYGSKDGRVSSISNYQIWDVTSPPPDLYQDDPSLNAGEVKQVDWQAWGAKVKFDYEIKMGEEVIFKKTYYSNYQPWQNVFLRGIKI
jgi:vancomycin resistance protein YoaR